MKCPICGVGEIPIEEVPSIKAFFERPGVPNPHQLWHWAKDNEEFRDLMIEHGWAEKTDAG